ncbi:hypothetical protein F4553_000495 [Allocatelliglobosispora scoriae]|uniref:HEAT repeat domain-containing protein n=1 Tax=Allocatelliglobosispora scoriae TaxID=643052 RepID=A0A841BIU1_9ACTN|nr:hypothetical protein [Allocatelliglobosispora scoriae]MBB5867116.1 hypothetical protein [Allocatelliglobosispora scoriae]
MPAWFADLWSADRARQNAAYESAMTASRDTAVPWAYDVWDEVVGRLRDPDNHSRAIAAQLLCNLAAHDTAGRVVADLDALIEVTRDKRFVTARHSLMALWRIGLAGDGQRRTVVAALDRRYRGSFEEKNGTLIRNDIVESLRKLHDSVADPQIEAAARALIEAEPDQKYRRKYAAHWR